MKKESIFFAFCVIISCLACNADQPKEVEAPPVQSAADAIPIAPHERLFAKYFTPYPNEIEKIPEGRAANTIRQQAFRLYDEGRYEQAELLFFELINQKGGNDTIFFYRGNAFLGRNYLRDARGELSRLGPDAPYFAQAKWYIALTYLKQNRLRETKVLLTQIVDSELELYNKTQAKALLQELQGL